MAIDGGAGILIFLVFVLFAVIIGILMLVFWIFMLVDCVKRKFKNENEKIVWVIVIIFTGIIGALIYYFIVKRNDNAKKDVNKSYKIVRRK